MELKVSFSDLKYVDLVTLLEKATRAELRDLARRMGIRIGRSKNDTAGFIAENRWRLLGAVTVRLNGFFGHDSRPLRFTETKNHAE